MQQPSIAIAKPVERADWQSYFKRYDVNGTIVVVDQRAGQPQGWVYNADRANHRFSPASTFKIPHSLFALDSNLVKDEFQVFKWDGIERSFAPHNQDQNLHSAMGNSAVWVYDDFAEQLGEKKAQHYVSLIDYGNAVPSFEHSSADGGSYWIDGELAISAVEQVDFLQKLYRNQLPFELADQLLVKDIMIVEAGGGWILRAKTGWQGQYGWWIGWVEWPTGPVFFALNIDTPNRMKDLYKRQAIVRGVLQSIDALPAEQ
ncbi:MULTISPECIES: class D beta-lactamase [unclassified Shewanella]|uniref:class D beta-lactamase n=1 Tax=unclassified Shewanella TaxID=196818 RepID=UPI001BC581B9|nr:MULTISPECIES: class D beta-lactamase [unclassified Shewanella]GIU08300.1 beta-lactamase [Shewanella sp. MBTL60-112-B1]GIU35192.1 beta-lactamase [Shewanella sp. MBTL60-112-B2]